ncbi:MAG: hypothetical protein F6K56_05420 [Moorea sp. SIO3G5]|nr:hypothetical protein [Moorena sp. SIO3G5]
MPIAYCLLPIAYCLLPVAYCRKCQMYLTYLKNAIYRIFIVIVNSAVFTHKSGISTDPLNRFSTIVKGSIVDK